MAHLTRYSRIQWSYHDSNTFIVSGSDIRLYKLNMENKIQKPSFNLIAINTEIPQIRCYDQNRDPLYSDLLAIGQSSGRINLIKLQNIYSMEMEENWLGYQKESIVKGYQIRSPRACNGIQFNPYQSNLLACGLDKIRNDHSLLIYDINKGGNTNGNGNGNGNGNQSAYISPKFNQPQPNLPEVMSDLATIRSFSNHRLKNQYQNDNDLPLYQLASSEAVHSLVWSFNNSFELIAGLGLKRLRLYDLRENNSINNSGSIFNTKCTYNLQIDPFNFNNILSHSDDGSITIYDLRKNDKPVLLQEMEVKSKTIQLNYNINKKNQLSLLNSDEKYIRLTDILNQENNELSIYRWRRSPKLSNNLSCYSWLPKELNINCKYGNQFLTINKEGEFNLNTIYDPIMFSLSPFNDITLQLEPIKLSTQNSFNNNNNNNNNIKLSDINNNRKEIKFKRILPSPHPNQLNEKSSFNFQLIKNEPDITMTMYERIKLGYGLNIEKNINIVKEQDLKYLWKFIQKFLSFYKKGSTKIENQEYLFHSLSKILLLNQQTNHNKKNSSSSINSRTQSNERVMKSPPSKKENLSLNYRQALCLELFNPYDLPFFQDLFQGVKLNLENINTIINNLEKNLEYGKAAILSFIMIGIEKTIQVLKDSNIDNYQWLALTLSNNIGNNNNWKESLVILLNKITDKKIQVLLNYFINRDYKLIVEHPGLDFYEKMLLAIKVLSDEDLKAFLDKYSKQLIKLGDLKGLYLLGFYTNNTLLLYNNYLDLTHDIQTVALLSSYTQLSPSANQKLISQSSIWYNNYKSILQNWKFYTQKCQLDVLKSRLISNKTNNPQILVRCNFCNLSISGQGLLTGNNANKHRSNRSLPISSGTNTPPLTNPSNVSNLSLGNKSIACPNCKKALPRCSLCRLYLGSAPDSLSSPFFSTVPQTNTPLLNQDNDNNNDNNSSTQLHNYYYSFSWCMSCRHGGHTIHLQSWFSSHDLCPVSDCNCLCNSI
ncbi:hypothetical protein K502DRAFT_340737 [Neoconidiobolus thromboides FSU 785]|nr:hypothetical protein K502DRAFT_340737 [Neoconidiobolus thromboides FSU 785]